MVRPVELTTGRVVLRCPQPEDVEDVLRACQDEENQRWIPLPSPYLRAHAEGWIGAAEREWAEEGELRFAVLDAVDGSFVGAMGLKAREEGMREIGYWTAPWARRRGLTTAAAVAVCRWGFDLVGLGRIEWLAQVGNVGSRAVAERVGFVVEGTARGRLTHRGERVDAWVAGLLPGDLR